ncbi:MAG TPA: hypothetical protein DCS07_02730 [Bdellovibrionales bacterium]|nr:MAG: hypothetical protein A2Z97_14310 [Bdellovibrionales bacterium GWB1_52_6]OFZ04441.1 MAG: hypothetical protein A2X97_07295 [Bdellovibrionales bacterium GWA1_52_35]OFZ40561.1 MAG: hypothetical protein A2070_06135 [Bdellovibrionales bacterium GWC1_52_8]HAR41539.1 hypothetical protein [Bdellovibrionales bacterium]HCM40699.1 hypothetical protein [Bdellovibrionales bacterium]
MPSGWDVYYIVFLSAFMALGIPAFLSLLSRGFSSKKKDSGKPELFLTPELPEVLTKIEGPAVSSFNTRFFVVANAGIVLITMILILIPCVGMIHQSATQDEKLLGLAAIISVSVLAATGLLYSAAKGDLSWLRAFQRKKADE